MAALRQLERALSRHDLARVRACPLGLLRRTDACVKYLTEYGEDDMLVAPLACAIEYALNALRDHRGYSRLWTADGSPNATGWQLINESPAFHVLDWFLDVFGDLDAPLQGVIIRSETAVTMTPLMYTLSDHCFRAQWDFLEVVGVLERLLRRGVRLEPNLANHHPLHRNVQESPLCCAFSQAHLCPFLIHMLIQAGARLAPGEGLRAARVCNGVSALRMLLPLYAGKLFANEAEQLELAHRWAQDRFVPRETLDMFRKLGLQLTPAVRALLPPDVLQQADADLETRRLRTLHAAGAMVRNKMPRDIRGRIEELVSDGVPWREGLGAP